MNSSVYVKGALQGLREKSEPISRETAISIQKLNVWYDEIQALQDVNLDIPRNSITAFIGPSGCGKTTLLRSLNRMNDLTKGFHLSGSIEILGEDIYAGDCNVTALRKKVGMVFQDANPFPMSVYNNLLLPLNEDNYKLDRKIAHSTVVQKLSDAGLYEEVKHRLHQSALQLSGGQQQRLCIARALMINPEILLLDEPCSALDPISTSKIESLLMEIKEHYTIVIVTHNLQQAARIADKVAFFYQGMIVEQGPADEIFVTPKDRRTEDYLRGIF